MILSMISRYNEKIPIKNRNTTALQRSFRSCEFKFQKGLRTDYLLSNEEGNINNDFFYFWNFLKSVLLVTFLVTYNYEQDRMSIRTYF